MSYSISQKQEPIQQHYVNFRTQRHTFTFKTVFRACWKNFFWQSGP